jgi:AmmeMemoRadiSam system protein B
MAGPLDTPTRIRPAAVAGTFYPADRARLRDRIAGLLRIAEPPTAPTPRALIVPHAGYQYSGPVAATAYAHLAATRSRIDSVLLLGPAHYVLFDGIALPGADALATPLGLVPVDLAAERRIRMHSIVHDLPDAHRPEHSLEVQLPFLQMVAAGPPVVALVTGRVPIDRVAAVVADALADPGTLVITSSDLSHYHDTATARELDAAAAAAIESLRPQDLAPDAACGLTAVAALLRAAADAGLEVTRLDLRNSGDIAGSPHRVVGYGAWSLGG